MAYTDKFQPTDELINEINTLKPHISSIALPKFTGAISVSAVTSYELAIKEILIDYASSKHHLFGGFIQNYLSRLNGRIKIPDLKNEIKKHLDKLPETSNVMLKVTLPTVENFYEDLTEHPRVVRVVALSGGYPREKANEILAKNKGVIASFSRALTEGLSAQQSDDEFNKDLAEAIKEIYEASVK